MKLTHKLYTYGAITIALIALALLMVTWQTPRPTEAATGGKFIINTVWLTDQASSTLARSSTNTGFITTPVGTTTPNEIFLGANSTTTVTLTTAGLSDIRLNFMANATSGPSSGPLTVSLKRSIVGYASTSDLYPDTDLATSGILGTLTENPVINVNLATTTDMNVNANSNAPSASVHLKNINAPALRLSIGTNGAIGLSLEVVEARPN